MSQTPDQQPDSPQPSEISLDELSEAFARAMGAEPGSLAEPESPSADQRGPRSDQRLPQPSVEPEPVASADQEDHCQISPRSIFEAMLFVGNRDGRPLAAERAAELMRGVEPDEIAGLVAELNQRYSENGRPLQILGGPGGYRLALREVFRPLQNRFYGRIRQARLSQAAIDVLAIVAYQQPLTGKRVSRLRGKTSGHLLSQLVRRGLLRIERQQTKRATAQYYTTDRFLKLFRLEGLDDLPQSEDLEGR